MLQRLGDNCTLKWSKVDFDKNMISVIPAKTKHSSGLEVELPMHPELRAELLKLKHKSPYVLPDTSARYILKARRSWLVVEIQRFLAGQGFQVHKDLEGVKRTAVVQYGYHSLRHTFISTCINPLIARVGNDSCNKRLRHSTNRFQALCRST